MVLIDARHESVDTDRSPEALAAEHKQQQRFQQTIWVAARIGLVRAFWAAAWPKAFPTKQNLSAETRAEIGVLQARSQQTKTVLREDALLTHDNAQLSTVTSLGNVPLIVLAAAQSVEHDPLWLPAQQEMARLSSNAKLIVVDGSSHYIHWDHRHSWWMPFARLSRPRVGDQQLGRCLPVGHDRAVPAEIAAAETFLPSNLIDRFDLVDMDPRGTISAAADVSDTATIRSSGSGSRS